MDSLAFTINTLIDKIINEKTIKIPLVDYFSWGRDKRHNVDNTERLPEESIGNNDRLEINKKDIIIQFNERYATFGCTYELMSDEYSKNLFAELILMKIISEKNMRLNSFSQEFIDSYEKASQEILNSNDILPVYTWALRKVTIDEPQISIFTVPTILNLHHTNRLYRYHNNNITVEVEGGDVLIDAGVGWGDTTVYLAARANMKPGGHSYAFDILKDGMNALSEQCKCNPHVDNITPVLKALSDRDDEFVYITAPSPGARVIDSNTGVRVETISIDTFVEQNNIEKIDFIKMDIEGSEVGALIGAKKTIHKFKPKLAISVYHKRDDLLVIPELINSIRNDYSFYLDCTTGFGGETVLYCK